MPSTTRTASSAARCNASILDPVVAEAARVSLAARTLSQLERDVLALSAGRGLSIRQIALLLGIGERRAERLLAKALGKFDRALERQGGARLQF